MMHYKFIIITIIINFSKGYSRKKWGVTDWNFVWPPPQIEIGHTLLPQIEIDDAPLPQIEMCYATPPPIEIGYAEHPSPWKLEWLSYPPPSPHNWI